MYYTDGFILPAAIKPPFNFVISSTSSALEIIPELFTASFVQLFFGYSCTSLAEAIDDKSGKAAKRFSPVLPEEQLQDVSCEPARIHSSDQWF